MTRETKIGLLVGLAFIIVIGILLSDHLTTSTEPPQATLAQAGNNVRSAVTTPGAATNPPITNVITPAPIAPQQAVPTQQDVAPRAQPVQPVQVAVGGPTKTSSPVVEVSQAPTPATLSAPQLVDNSNATSTDANSQATENTAIKTADASNDSSSRVKYLPVAPANDSNTSVASALRNAAQQHGEELVAVGGANAKQTAAGSTPTGNTQQAAGKKYVALDGDTFWKIVARQMGTNNKANRDAFVAANASLKDDPNKIIAGHTYIIPASTASAGTPTGVATSVATASASNTTQTPSPSSKSPDAAPVKSVSNTLPAATAGDNWYTIKEGETLTNIAEEQCGTSQAVTAILELNKDTLKDPNKIVANTKIKLPNKPVAVAN